MMMDTGSPVEKLCISVTQAEFSGRLEDARRLAWLAWQAATNDYEACIAAHYLARYKDDANEAFYWNQVALERARATDDRRVLAYYPSLYLNMGRSCERLGDLDDAEHYYRLAAASGLAHQGEQDRAEGVS